MTGITPKQREVLRKALSPTRACPSIERLASLPEAPLEVRDHVLSCLRCQAELSLLGDFEAAAPRVEEKSAVRWISMRVERRLTAPRARERAGADAEPWWRRWFTLRSLSTAGLGVAAATILVAVSVGVRDNLRPALTAPSGPAVLAFRSDELTAIAPSGDLLAPPAELRWQPVPAAFSYAVRVTEVDGTERWSAVTADTRATLPRDVRRRALPGKPLLWQVIARDAAGQAIAKSGVQRFRVRIPAQ